MPVLNIPLESLCGDIGCFSERDDAHMLAKGVFLSILTDLNLVGTSLE
jgi:hypothetical protein